MTNAGAASTSNNGSSRGGRARPHFTTTTYPSKCLQFLKELRRETIPAPDAALTKPRLQLHVLIVGAGLGGLAAAVALARAGHKVTVLEQATQLAEVGAGIQIPPNAGKLLARWGVMDELAGQAVQPDGISFRRWSSGERIGYTDLSPGFASTYGAPYHVVHRAHLHTALFRRAEALGVSVVLDSRVVAYDPSAPSVSLADGTVFRADLVVGADGVKSAAREYIPAGPRAVPKPTGFAVYRATVDVRKMREIPELDWILEKPAINLWIGEDRHVMTYTIASGQSFNMVLSHVDNSDPAQWQNASQEETLEAMRAEFGGWDPQLCKIMSLITNSLKWPLMGNNSLERWVSPSSRLVVLGDAAHAMVPYMSQGAAMAVEDGAALAVAVSKIASTSELGFVLGIFEEARSQRTGMMQEASMVNAMLWHFPDGPEQRARDKAMCPETEGRHFVSSPNQWSDPMTQAWAYGYDAEEVMEERWDGAIRQLIARQS